MSDSPFSVRWVLRRKGLARSLPDPNYPYGIALDVSREGEPACECVLTYPAPGVGSWVLTCEVCGATAVVTAAGRADDPTKVRLPCKVTP